MCSVVFIRLRYNSKIIVESTVEIENLEKKLKIYDIE